MSTLPQVEHPDLLVGYHTADDAGVFRLSDDCALIQTIDFFTPIVDSPYDFGRIAAANAFSDVYAMGGKPLTAMNIVCFPSCDLPESVLAATLAGGFAVIKEAGAVLVGGHSIDDQEFKYGLAVTGIVRPEGILTNAGARPGDLMILTKPIGTGVIATAVKGRMADETTLTRLVEITAALNREAAETALRHHPTACTDVTGFGLAGHAFEIAAASKVEIILQAESVPLIQGAYDLAAMGMLPAGAYANKTHFSSHVSISPDIDDILTDLMFDPQTSGGLLVCLPEKTAPACTDEMRAAGIECRVIGRVETVHPEGIVRIIH